MNILNSPRFCLNLKYFISCKLNAVFNIIKVVQIFSLKNFKMEFICVFPVHQFLPISVTHVGLIIAPVTPIYPE